MICLGARNASRARRSSMPSARSRPAVDRVTANEVELGAAAQGRHFRHHAVGDKGGVKRESLLDTIASVVPVLVELVTAWRPEVA